MKPEIKLAKRYRRRKRVRAKIKGTVQVPRLSVFRSAKHIYAQLIDDENGKTLVAASDRELKFNRTHGKGNAEKGESRGAMRGGKVAVAYEVGRLVAEKAKAKKIQKVVFDRGCYKYHGRVKALAEGAREGGLEF